MATKVEIRFRTEKVMIGSGETAQTILISQLVPAGAEVAVIIEPESSSLAAGERDERKPEVLVAGEGVQFSAGKKTLVAQIPGYPRHTIQKELKAIQRIVDIEPLVTVDDECWMAKMTLYPPVTGVSPVDVQAVVAMLHQAGIRSGIREKNIHGALEAVATDKLPVRDVIVARGRLPVNGEDAMLRIDIETDSHAGKEMGDGRIDFHERRFFMPVNKGQLLATKIAATSGLPGVDVHGKEIAQRPGKDLTVKVTEDITFDQKTGEIRAACNGVLSAVSHSGVRVTAKLMISADVDFQTGNIHSQAAVEIRGTVKPGFKVTTGGDLVIGGNIESASVRSYGNLAVGGGIFGEESQIEADGDISVPIIDHGRVSAKGRFLVGREAYYSELRSLGDIICQGSATIVSCDLLAGGSVTANDVDTFSSPNSIIAAATLPERYGKYLKLLKTTHQTRAAIEAWRRRFGVFSKSDDLLELQEEHDEASKILSQFNVIPGADDRDRMSGLRYACRQRITINGTIRSGAVIRIGNAETTLKKDYSRGFFTLNCESGKLEFHPDNDKGPGIAIEPCKLSNKEADTCL